MLSYSLCLIMMLFQVVKDVGLCIGLFDILEFGNSYIFPGDGAAHTKVEFRFVIFRPFIEEVILGKIKGCNKEGVQGSLLSFIKYCVTLFF